MAISDIIRMHPDILVAFDELMWVRARTQSAVLSQAGGRTLNRVMVEHGFTRDDATMLIVRAIKLGNEIA